MTIAENSARTGIKGVRIRGDIAVLSAVNVLLPRHRRMRIPSWSSEWHIQLAMYSVGSMAGEVFVMLSSTGSRMHRSTYNVPKGKFMELIRSMN